MYRLSNRGLSAVDIFGQRCTPTPGDYSCPAAQWWLNLWGMTDTTVGVAPAPPVEVWSKPPASGEEAQATVDALLNAQLEAQKRANAEGVESSWVDSISSGAVAAGDAISAPGGLSWLVWGALGLGAFALVAVGGGSARRYGR